jgi:hypothetical protein
VLTWLQAALSGVRIPAWAVLFFSNLFYTGPVAHAASPIEWESRYIPGVKSRSVILTAKLHVFPRLRMSGVIPLFFLFVFMACTGTSLHFTKSRPAFLCVL